MANPNRTVLNARRKIGGFPNKPPKPLDDFMQWVGEKALNGIIFTSLEEAQSEFEKYKKETML